MEKNCLISVVIPIYNASQYISSCLDSIISLRQVNLEVILVNDGSTDNSLEICERYKGLDQRIKVFSQDNAGVSAARNKGIEEATGEWVIFIDADDIIDTEQFKQMLPFLSDENDFVWGGYRLEDEKGTILYELTGEITETLLPIQALERLFKPTHYKYQGYLCNKFLKLNIIKDNNLYLDPQIKYNEDRLFNFQYLCKCSKSGCFCNKPFYRYLQREGSAMGSLNGPKYKLFITDLMAFEKMYKITVADSQLQSLEPLVKSGLINSYYWNRRLMIDRHELDIFHIIKCLRLFFSNVKDMKSVKTLCKFELRTFIKDTVRWKISLP